MIKRTLLFLALLGSSCPGSVFSPEPEIDKASFAPSGTLKPSILVVSHSTLDVKYVDAAIENHLDYVKKQQYHYVFRNGSIDGGRFQDPRAGNKIRQLGLYWQKIAAVQDALAKKNTTSGGYLYDWVMWIDADAIFTNLDTRIESVIAKYPNANFIIATDNIAIGLPDHTNSGVFLVRNDSEATHQWSTQFIQNVARLHPLYKDRKFPEQEAIQDLIYNYIVFAKDEITEVPFEERGYKESRIIEGARVIPQREINTYWGWNVKAQSQWQPGDFIAHFNTQGSKKNSSLRTLLDCLKKNGNNLQLCTYSILVIPGI